MFPRPCRVLVRCWPSHWASLAHVPTPLARAAPARGLLPGPAFPKSPNMTGHAKRGLPQPKPKPKRNSSGPSCRTSWATGSEAASPQPSQSSNKPRPSRGLGFARCEVCAWTFGLACLACNQRTRKQPVIICLLWYFCGGGPRVTKTQGEQGQQLDSLRASCLATNFFASAEASATRAAGAAGATGAAVVLAPHSVAPVCRLRRKIRPEGSLNCFHAPAPGSVLQFGTWNLAAGNLLSSFFHFACGKQGCLQPGESQVRTGASNQQENAVEL